MKKGKIKINEERCKGCLICIKECKKGCIVTTDRINRIGYPVVAFEDNGKCNACTLCAIVCPDAAIEVFQIIEEDVKK